MRPPRRTHPARGTKLSPSKLDALIAEAISDGDSDSEGEERTGLFTTLDGHIEVPFETRVLDIEVSVERLDLTEAGEIVAICRRGEVRQAIPIEAYRRWAEGRRIAGEAARPE